MNLEEQIKFQEQIVTISKFYTSPYLSENTLKLLWSLFILNSVFISLFSGFIQIKEITLLMLNIELSAKQTLVLILLSIAAVNVKIFTNIYSDLKNWKYEKELYSYRFAQLNHEMQNRLTASINSSDAFHTQRILRHERLSAAFLKAQQAKTLHSQIYHSNAQEQNISHFLELKYKFITSILQAANEENELIMSENMKRAKIIGRNMQTLFSVIKSYRRQLIITTLSNVALPVSTSLYIIYLFHTLVF